ncbi:MAG: urease accessory protein UreE [Notoacmeibacter sp.]|nr:urease accessory protein UreE [Notoacmeibacter sp.]MCC0032342.1 urease accessory protein UreE [Brucellaceae bacterium]
MLTCTSVTRHFHETAGTITLDETARHRRRILLESDNGIRFMLDLAQARLLRHGDGLQLSDGRVIVVQAEPEDLYEVRATDGRHLLALAWQIGNRHLAAQIEGNRILIRADHVIREMLEGLGAAVTGLSAPFDPEGGAYGGAHQGHHHHDHNHGHGHSHGHHDPHEHPHHHTGHHHPHPAKEHE